MHILMTADTLGGVWTYTRELVTGLISRGHRVTLVSLGQHPTASQADWLCACPNLDYRPTEFRLEWMQDAAADLEKSESYLQTVISEVRPDLLHFNQFCYGRMECAIPRLVVAHSDVLSWWSNVNEEPAPQNDWINWYRSAVAEGLSGATLIVTPSRWMLNALGENYSFAAPSRAIYNGRSSDLFDPNRSKCSSVLTVGRLWDQGKQASLLLHKCHPVPVFVVGQHQCADQKFAADRAVSTNASVNLCGEQSPSQLRDLYAQCSTYAATSKYEPFGLAPLEAALSRCALVVNDIPVFRELWQDAALFFARNDAASLADAIRQLAADSRLRAEYADRAYEHARSSFSTLSMLDEYEQLYRSLAGRRADA